jgi:hypothetical protein
VRVSIASPLVLHSPNGRRVCIRIDVVDGARTRHRCAIGVIVRDGRDRNRPRLAVGKGFPFPLFRLRNGFTVSPWRTFAEAPLESRTARFPGSGSKPWRVTIGLPKAWRGLNAGSYPPPPLLVCLQPRLLEPSSAYVPVLSSRPPRRPRRPPSVQSPFAQLGCYLRWGDVDRLLGGSYPSVVARTGSCVAPVGLSPPSVFSLVWRVLAGCYQSLLPTAASRRYFREPFLGCWIPYPGGTPCALTCFFHGVIGLPQVINGSASRICPANDDFSQAPLFEAADIP